MSRDPASAVPLRRAADRWAALGGLAVLAVSWVAATADEVSALEEDLFRFFNDWPDWLESPGWAFMQFGAIAVVPVVGLAAWWWWRRPRPVAGFVGAGFVVWVLAKVVKELVGRGRPAELLAEVTQRPEWSGLGFPSGHVCVAFALATVGTLYLPRRWRWVMFALAAATSIMRMYTAAHLPLDIVGGAGLGVAAGGVFNSLLAGRATAARTGRP
jgi:undecaprenyl-diphosphatase